MSCNKKLRFLTYLILVVDKDEEKLVVDKEVGDEVEELDEELVEVVNGVDVEELVELEVEELVEVDVKGGVVLLELVEVEESVVVGVLNIRIFKK